MTRFRPQLLSLDERVVPDAVPTGSPQPPDSPPASSSSELDTSSPADWLAWFTDNQSVVTALVADGMQQAGGISGYQLGRVEAFTYTDERPAGASRADLLIYIAPAGGEAVAGSDGTLLHVQGTGLDHVNPQDLNIGAGEFFDRLGRGVVGAVTGAVSGAGTGMVVGGVVGSVAPGPGTIGGAAVGGTAGAVGGAVTGFIRGVFSDSLGEAAEQGAYWGVGGGGAGAVIRGGIVAVAAADAAAAAAAAQRALNDAIVNRDRVARFLDRYDRGEIIPRNPDDPAHWLRLYNTYQRQVETHQHQLDQLRGR